MKHIINISQEINGGAFSRVLILNNFLLRLTPQSAYGALKRNESEDTEATLLGCKGPVIDLNQDDQVIDLARDDEDPAPLLGERSTWRLRVRASGLPEIWELLPHEAPLRKDALGRGAMELVGYAWYS